MTPVLIEPLIHHGQHCVAIRFAYDRTLIELVKKIEGAAFSKTHKCWYVIETKNVVEDIVNLLQGKAQVEYSAFKLEQEAFHQEQEKQDGVNIYLQLVERKLKLRGYSKNTVRTYIEQFKLFLSFFWPTKPEELNEADIRNYLLYLVEKRELSKSTQNQAINSIKFFFEKILMQPKKVYYLERPMKERTLPEILSEEEVVKIFSVEMNPKHKLMLMLIYSGGLRRSELLNLRKGDVDTARKTIFVKGGKGKKDRQTILAESIIPLIDAYVDEVETLYWFFEGQDHNQYSTTSLQNIFKNAVTKAGIRKNVHLHTLRHSFATHLLEHGTATRYIQELLGHESPMTTEIYTQVTKFALDKIKSPLDILDTKKLGRNDE